ncbi:MAG: formyltransferase family protein [Veillonellales bacterium]
MKFQQVIVLGSGKIAVECIDSLVGHTNMVIAVEQEEQPISFVRVIGRKYGLEYHRITNKQDLTEYLDRIEAETLVISANNNYLFPAKILRKKNFSVVNFHNSLLPDYPGRNAPTWVIFNDEKTTGITWHLADEGVDTGNILSQKTIGITPTVTALELTKQCMDAGAEAFREMLPGILEGQFSGNIQDVRQRKNFHYAKDIPNNGYLEVSWSLDKVSAFLRSLNYGRAQLFPPSKVVLLGQRYFIKKYRIIAAITPEYHMDLCEKEIILQDGQRRIHIALQRAQEDEVEEQENGEAEKVAAGNQTGDKFHGDGGGRLHTSWDTGFL